MTVSTGITIDGCEIRFLDPYFFAHVIMKIRRQDEGPWATIDMTLPIDPHKATLPCATLRAEIEQLAHAIVRGDAVLQSVPDAPAASPPSAQ